MPWRRLSICHGSAFVLQQFPLASPPPERDKLSPKLAERAMQNFKALVVTKPAPGLSCDFVDFDEAELMDGDVTVRVTHSTVNYKDGLAITGKGPVVRRFPMIPGVDFAGEVIASTHRDWSPGDHVILNGW